MTPRPPLIAHVIHRFAIGGMENGLVNLINGMDVRFAHAIVCFDGYTDFSTRLTRDDVSLHDVGKKPGKDPGHYARLWRVFRALRPTVVHTRNIGAIEAGVVAKLAGVATVLHGEHGWDVHDLRGSNPRYRRLRRLCSPFISRFVCVSAQIRDWLRDQVGIAPRKLVQIYNGVDSERFNPAGRDAARRLLHENDIRADFIVGSVGRLEEVKNPVATVDAYALACDRDAGFRCSSALVFVGGGRLESQLRSRVAGLALEGRVHFLGRRDDVAQLLPGFDVHVLPSLNEGISNTILEAMACGVPVVASEVGGNPELVSNGLNGFLYPCEDLDALAGWLGRYQRDAAERERHAVAARARALEHFSLQRMIRNYEDVYSQYC